MRGRWRKAVRAVKTAIVSLVTDDTTTWPQAQLAFNGVATTAVRINPYGISSNPPLNGYAILLSPHDREGHQLALIDAPTKRFKELKEGEVKIGNYLTQAFVFFDQQGNLNIDTDGNIIARAGGNVEVDCEGNAVVQAQGTARVQAGGTLTLQAPTVAVQGNLTVSGTLVSTGPVTGAGVGLSTHTHTHGAGAGTTAPGIG